jgi:predicted AlkP superfamily pyrophosphatase or phosphodiesterase
VLALATPLLPLRLAVSWTLAAPTIAKGAITLIEDGVRVDVLDGSA